MPGLHQRMAEIEQRYIALKANSEKIQSAEYKPLIQRAKDYLLGLAAVAILLMFINMLSSKVQSFMKARESMKKMKEMMNDGNNFYPTIGLLPFLLLLLTGCDKTPQMLSLLNNEKSDSTQMMILSQPEFSDQWKTMVIDARLGKGVGPLSLSDPKQVRVDVTETVHHLSEASYPVPPKLVKIENVASQEMKKLSVKMLALVDLTLPQSMINQERQAIREMKNLFSDDNLYVAFIKGTSVSETMPVTDYILRNYFIHCDSTTKFLYRSILVKMNEMDDSATWTANAKYMAMVVMSDGETYKDDMPMDPFHFEIEHQLASCEINRPLYYVNFSNNNEANALYFDLEDIDFMDYSESGDPTILQSRCVASKGLYQQQFDWPAIKANIQKAFGIDFVDYRFTLENPDHKVYRGRNGRDLQIACYDVATDSLLVKGNCYYKLGSVYNPVIVNPQPLSHLLVAGIINTLFLILLLYGILQFVVPYIRYRLFLKEHVVTFSGTLMGTEGAMVGESCYMCKAPFKIGEQIVTKCQHTMHLECWDENQYQCPEYGRHCKNGRHYYNRHQLLDPENATFYMKWIIIAIFAGLAAWITYTVQMHPTLSSISKSLILFANGIKPDDPQAPEMIAEYGSMINHFPSFGLCIGFFLTLMLSYLSVAQREWLPRIADILVRALLGGFGGLLFFSLGGFISVVLGLKENTFLIDWIPWALTGYWVALCVIWRTRIRLCHSQVIGAILIGILSTYLWTWLYAGTTVDYRQTLLINFIVYAVAMAISIAKNAPRSERYFLTVSGIMKQMDVALYKWFKDDPNDHVTIGHSVDCHLQLSWDIQSTIAPIQAEIRMLHGTPWLYAVEDGVFVKGKMLAAGNGIRLYHGRTFSIGKTTFTYIEKDN